MLASMRINKLRMMGKILRDSGKNNSFNLNEVLKQVLYLAIRI